MSSWIVRVLITTGAFGLSAHSAAAATIVSGLVAENQVLDPDGTVRNAFGGGTYAADIPDHVFGDFGNTTADPVLSFLGSTNILGYMATPWADIFGVVADNYTYSLEFSVQGGTLEMDVSQDGGATTSVTSSTGAFQLTGLTGASTFFMTGTSGQGFWQVSVYDVQPLTNVPLPATGGLLLAATGGLVLRKRETKFIR